MHEVVILDCYTDEPSGYGVRPYLGTHQLHLSQALEFSRTPHSYITIDDLRYCSRGVATTVDTDITTVNTTSNRDCALDLVKAARVIYVIMGCFVEYAYFSCDPPRSDEVFGYLERSDATKVLFYVMGTLDGIAPDYASSRLQSIISVVEHGNTYRYVLEKHGSSTADNLINPNYQLLAEIGRVTPPLLAELTRPIIAEIETGTGCNTPTCKFCIESVRSPRVQYRGPDDIVSQVGVLYDAGVRHFRLGRQPNFFHYARQDVGAMERLLAGIRDRCPSIRMLHIDNVNIVNVITPAGRQLAELIATYCTSSNVAPFGVESFDNDVRRATGVVGSPDDVLRAIEVINSVGARRGSDGLPVLLPGINLIDGLPGETEATHARNLAYLQRIVDLGLLTYRLYYRDMTSPTGISLSAHSAPKTSFAQRFNDVVAQFVLPMQERVYPVGTVVHGDWEAINLKGDFIARTYGTCSIKVRLQDHGAGTGPVPLSVRITGNMGYRLLNGEVVQ